MTAQLRTDFANKKTDRNGLSFLYAFLQHKAFRGKRKALLWLNILRKNGVLLKKEGDFFNDCMIPPVYEPNMNRQKTIVE